MIYVDLSKVSPTQEWLDKAKKLTDALRATDEDGRREILAKNDKVWRELLAELLKASNNKCWYSENTIAGSHVDVDHFRPKSSAKNLDGTEREGYWWLAFDYRNYRAAGSIVNRDLKNHMFPLRDGSVICLLDGNLDDEQPYFLDPTKRSDVVLLNFNEEGGIFCSTNGEWDGQRVEITVKYFKLDNPMLRNLRKSKWQECQDLLERIVRQYKLYQQGSPTAKGRFEELIEQLRRMKDSDQEFASTVRSFLKVKANAEIPLADFLAQ
jgi:hypothetical protein